MEKEGSAVFDAPETKPKDDASETKPKDDAPETKPKDDAPPSTDDNIPQLDTTSLEEYDEMWNDLKIKNDNYDSSYIFFLRPIPSTKTKNGKTNKWICHDIKELLRGVTLDSIKTFSEKYLSDANKYSLLQLLFVKPNDNPLNYKGDKTYFDKTGGTDLVFGGAKRRRSSKKTSLKTRSENNLRWLAHIALRSLQQINSGKNPVSRKSSTNKPVTKKPVVATKDDLLKVAKKLKLSGLSSKTKKDIASAIRNVDVKKLNESQKKTFEKFKNMKM